MKQPYILENKRNRRRTNLEQSTVFVAAIILAAGLGLLATARRVGGAQAETPSSGQRGLEPEEIWSRVGPSVIRIEAELLNGQKQTGSGFVCEIQTNKYILTCRHVILGARRIRVGAEEALVAADRYKISAQLDLALIEPPPTLRCPVLKARPGGVRTAERVYAIGFPLNMNKSITQGLINSQTEELIQFDAPISSGNSGGPLVDKQGLVVGVVTAGSTGSSEAVVQNLNFAIKTSFVPKAELFQDPILRFYDAWKELVKVENRLTDDLQDLCVLDVEKCVQAEMGWLVMSAGTGKNNLLAEIEPEKRAQMETLFKQNYSESLTRVINKYGTLDKGVQSVVGFLRGQRDRFDQIPGLFMGIGSDELFRQFSREKRKVTLLTWDFQADDLVPLLKVSAEHAKAAYEDKAYQIGFTYRSLLRARTNAALVARELEKCPENLKRTTVRLSYSLANSAPEEDRVKLYYLSQQSYGFNKSLEDKTTFDKKTLTETIALHGGFEGFITSMFEKMALETLEQGTVSEAKACLALDWQLRKQHDLRLMAFFAVCAGEFDNAYELYGRAYLKTEYTDPFSLKVPDQVHRRVLLSELEDDWGDRYINYSPSIRQKLREWKDYVGAKDAWGLTQMPPPSGIASPKFQEINDFEKCWVILRQFDKAVDLHKTDEFWDLVRKFDSRTQRLYFKYQ